MVKTGVPSDSFHRFWSERIFGAEASKTFLADASRLFAVRVVSLWIMGLESAQVESAVEVDDVAGAEGEVSPADGFGSEADIFGFSPAFLWDEAFGDQFVVFILHAGRHIGCHHAGAKFDNLNAVGGESGGPELGGHGESGLGDAVFATVDGGGVGGDRGDEDQFVATMEKGFSGVGQPVTGGKLAEEVGAFEIHVNDFIENFFFGLGDIGSFAGGDARVVDQGIEASEAFENSSHQAGAIFGGAELGRDGQKLLVFAFGDGLASGDGFLGGLAVGGVVDGEVVAFGSQAERDAPAEPSARSSDENDRSRHGLKSNPSQKERDGGKRFS